MDTEEIHSESKSSNIEKKMINDDLVMTKKKLKVINVHFCTFTLPGLSSSKF